MPLFSREDRDRLGAPTEVTPRMLSTSGQTQATQVPSSSELDQLSQNFLLLAQAVNNYTIALRTYLAI